MKFTIVSGIRDIEVIASGSGVRIRRRLWRLYGRGNRRKMKGVAEVMYADGTRWLSELHWYEAHGIGKRELRIKLDPRLL